LFPSSYDVKTPYRNELLNIPFFDNQDQQAIADSLIFVNSSIETCCRTFPEREGKWLNKLNSV